MNGDLPVRCTFPSSLNFPPNPIWTEQNANRSAKFKCSTNARQKPRTKCVLNGWIIEKNTHHNNNARYTKLVRKQKCNGKMASTNCSIRYDNKQWLPMFLWARSCSCTWSFWSAPTAINRCMCVLCLCSRAYVLSWKIQHSRNRFQPKIHADYVF